MRWLRYAWIKPTLPETVALALVNLALWCGLALGHWDEVYRMVMFLSLCMLPDIGAGG